MELEWNAEMMLYITVIIRRNELHFTWGVNLFFFSIQFKGEGYSYSANRVFAGSEPRSLGTTALCLYQLH